MSIFQKILFQGYSPINGEIRVVESFGERKLIASSYTQSRSLNKEGRTGSYWDGFILNLPSLTADSRILILGLAGGTIAKLLTREFGPIAIDGVDIDPLMVELGKKYFDFKESNVNIIIADAIRYVDEARFKYDVICIDLFAKGDVAVGAESKTFFEKVKRSLAPNGIVVINKLFTSNLELEKYLDFLHEIFARTDTLLIGGRFRSDNVIVYAYP